MRHLYTLLFVLIILTTGVWAAWVQWTENRDWKTVEKTLGVPGQVEGDGFKVLVPRKDLNVLVHGTWLAPSAGLVSWFAFEPSTKGCLLIGELTIVDGEVAGIEKQLLAQGLTLTALYRPYTGETPGVEKVRFEGRGRRAALAQKAKALLAATGMPKPLPSTKAVPKPEPWMQAVQKLLGPGQIQERVLGLTYVPMLSTQQLPPPLPSYMGASSDLYFQADGKQAQIYGQWVVPAQRAGAVLTALAQARIPVTGTSALLNDQALGQVLIPFWAQGDPVELAKGLKEVLKASGLMEEPAPEQTPNPSQTQER